MQPSTICSIRLLSKTYEMKCPEHEVSNLEAAAQRLDHLLREQKEKFPKLTEFQLMVLSSVILSHELLLCQQQQSVERAQVEQVVNWLGKTKGMQPVTQAVNLQLESVGS